MYDGVLGRWLTVSEKTCYFVDMFRVQVWNLTNCKLKTNHYGHTGYVNTVTVSPDGSLCASGGKVCSDVVSNSVCFHQQQCG